MANAKIKKGARLTGDARSILLADLEYMYVVQRMTIRQLVVATGRSHGTIHRMLSTRGVLRSKGGKPRQLKGAQ